MDRVEKLYQDLIRINSVSGNENEIAHFIGRELESMGLTPHYTHYGEMTQSDSVVTVLDSGKPGKNILLIGHIDTVDFGKGWETDPLVPTVVGDRTYGRGAMDMKGGDTAILETLRYYTEHKEEFTGKITAAFVADEEVLSRGTYQVQAEGWLDSVDYAVMGECRFDNVAVGFRGRYVYDILVKGKVAHTKYYPQEGENAILTAAAFAAEIEKLPTASHPKMNCGTWCVKTIEGGYDNALKVCDECKIGVERYVVPGETVEGCLQQLVELAEKLGITEKVEIQLRPRELPYMEAFDVPEDHELVKSVRKHYADIVGESLPCAYDMSVCDSCILGAMGIPTITFGPSGGNMHQANEYGYYAHVTACIEIYKRIVRDMLNA